ncbi:unnamed protein product [Boreogadus saida]
MKDNWDSSDRQEGLRTPGGSLQGLNLLKTSSTSPHLSILHLPSPLYPPPFPHISILHSPLTSHLGVALLSSATFCPAVQRPDAPLPDDCSVYCCCFSAAAITPPRLLSCDHSAAAAKERRQAHLLYIYITAPSGVASHRHHTAAADVTEVESLLAAELVKSGVDTAMMG